MRINRKMLLKLADQTVLNRTNAAHDIVAIYLTGSVARLDDPLLGGTTDIDLVFVHQHAPRPAREIQPLSPDIHLDIIHRHVDEYEPARALRDNPWLGPEMYAPHLLFEQGHFFEFTQAAVRAEFDAPLHRLRRCRQIYAHGRELWMDLQLSDAEMSPERFGQYLKAVMHAANALVALDDGQPLGTRRFLTDFAHRAAALGQAARTNELTALLGQNAAFSPDLVRDWLPAWEQAFDSAAAQQPADVRLQAARKDYYLKGMHALLDGSRPQDALWPLLTTWTQSVASLDADSAARQPWRQALQALGLTGESFAARLAALDAFLDAVDVLLENLAAQNGLEE